MRASNALQCALRQPSCPPPIHNIMQATTGKPVAVILRPARRLRDRGGAGAAPCHWPASAPAGRRSRSSCAATAITAAQGHGVVRASAGSSDIFCLSGNPVLLRQVSLLTEDAALGRPAADEGEKVAAMAIPAMPPETTTATRTDRRRDARPKADSRSTATSLAGARRARSISRRGPQIARAGRPKT